MYLFLSEFRQQRHPANTPPSNSVLLLLQTTGGQRSPARLWSAAQHRASQDSNQFLIPGGAECGSWQVLSWARSLALSKWTAGAALFWVNYRNHT
jgi:hypothetical protein